MFGRPFPSMSFGSVMETKYGTPWILTIPWKFPEPLYGSVAKPYKFFCPRAGRRFEKAELPILGKGKLEKLMVDPDDPTLYEPLVEEEPLVP